MTQTLYVTFPDATSTEKALGALLDFGVSKDDITVVAEENATGYYTKKAAALEDQGKTGITTTTPEDAGAGAAKGAGIGLGLGVLGGLAALLIPGFGIVLGGGALASALVAAGATTAAGAVAGGVTGYLKDQGLSQDVSSMYVDRLKSGSSLVTLTLPSGKVGTETGREIVGKYGGADIYVS